jgi:hypothetical protein
MASENISELPRIAFSRILAVFFIVTVSFAADRRASQAPALD